MSNSSKAKVIQLKPYDQMTDEELVDLVKERKKRARVDNSPLPQSKPVNRANLFRKTPPRK